MASISTPTARVVVSKLELTYSAPWSGMTQGLSDGELSWMRRKPLMYSRASATVPVMVKPPRKVSGS